MSREDDRSLRFYNEVLGLDHLHYGIWNGDEELTLANLKEAQLRYENYLISKLPPSAKKILDVGCGIGTTLRAGMNGANGASGTLLASPGRVSPITIPGIDGVLEVVEVTPRSQVEYPASMLGGNLGPYNNGA